MTAGRDDLAGVLRRQGGRVTRARELVWEVLHDSAGHLTAQEIAERVTQREAQVNMSSVYRALELFAELELVRESRTDADGSTTWELRHGDSEIHVVCETCAEVVHYGTGRVDQLRTELVAAGFEVDAIDVRVHGTCPNCATPSPP